MSDYSTLPAEKLKRLMEETEQSLIELRQEMDRRAEAAQGKEIDRLDEHMRSAELSLTVIKDFFRYLSNEARPGDKKEM